MLGAPPALPSASVAPACSPVLVVEVVLLLLVGEARDHAAAGTRGAGGSRQPCERVPPALAQVATLVSLAGARQRQPLGPPRNTSRPARAACLPARASPTRGTHLITTWITMPSSRMLKMVPRPTPNLQAAGRNRRAQRRVAGMPWVPSQQRGRVGVHGCRRYRARRASTLLLLGHTPRHGSQEPPPETHTG